MDATELFFIALWSLAVWLAFVIPATIATWRMTR
jgi:hypothetical protein